MIVANKTVLLKSKMKTKRLQDQSQHQRVGCHQLIVEYIPNADLPNSSLAT